MLRTNCRQNPAAAPAAKQRGGTCGAPGHPAQSPVEWAESERERESAPVLLSVARPALVLQKRQTAVSHTTPVQSMVIGPVGRVGLSVLVRVSMTSVMMSSSRPNSDIARALAPPPPLTLYLPATVALETASRLRTAVSCPTVQWMAAGACGLHQVRALSPVGRGYSCQPGPVIPPPLNMAADSVMDQTLRAASVKVPVQSTGFGPVGPAGESVPLPVSHKAELQSGLATAPVLTPPPQLPRPAEVAMETTTR